MKVKDCNRFTARRFINKYAEDIDFHSRVVKALEHEDLEIFDQEDLDKMHADFPHSAAHRYMHKRGFEKETLKKFGVGTLGQLVIVPMHNFRGQPIGYIGRDITEKRFQNSKGLKTSRTLFNLHRAKGNKTAIVIEASFDAMMVDAAGYPNVVATLKGHISKYQVDYLKKYFDDLLMFADNDNGPGIELGFEVKKKTGMQMRWANLDEYDGLKDATDLGIDRIRNAILNSVSHAEMLEFAGDSGIIDTAKATK